MKKWYKSRTVWIELVQAVIGLLTALLLFLQGLNEEAMAALAVGAKGVYSVWLRFNTTQPITK